MIALSRSVMPLPMKGVMDSERKGKSGPVVAKVAPVSDRGDHRGAKVAASFQIV